MPVLHATGMVVRLDELGKIRIIHVLSLQPYDDILSSRKIKLGVAPLHTDETLEKNFVTIGHTVRAWTWAWG
jgi:hypothetical protein